MLYRYRYSRYLFFYFMLELTASVTYQCCCVSFIDCELAECCCRWGAWWAAVAASQTQRTGSLSTSRQAASSVFYPLWRGLKYWQSLKLEASNTIRYLSGQMLATSTIGHSPVLKYFLCYVLLFLNIVIILVGRSVLATPSLFCWYLRDTSSWIRPKKPQTQPPISHLWWVAAGFAFL